MLQRSIVRPSSSRAVLHEVWTHPFQGCTPVPPPALAIVGNSAVNILTPTFVHVCTHFSWGHAQNY